MVKKVSYQSQNVIESRCLFIEFCLPVLFPNFSVWQRISFFEGIFDNFMIDAFDGNQI
jgi:hypothetical protein